MAIELELASGHSGMALPEADVADRFRGAGNKAMSMWLTDQARDGIRPVY